MQKEIWKVVKGYDGIYEVSDLGRVKSLKRKSRINDIILKQHTKLSGYKTIGLSNGLICKKFRVHKLVAIAFLNHKSNDINLQVDHINNVKGDNRLENLQLLTQRENCSKDRDGKSKYTGVYLRKGTNKWRSCITINGKTKHLGTFNTEIDASNAYQKELSNLKQ
jgi:hypothetical protein